MPKVQILCPKCHGKFNIDEVQLGKKGKCSKCQTVFVLTVPEMMPVPVVAPSVTPAPSVAPTVAAPAKKPAIVPAPSCPNCRAPSVPASEIHVNIMKQVVGDDCVGATWECSRCKNVFYNHPTV